MGHLFNMGMGLNSEEHWGGAGSEYSGGNPPMWGCPQHHRAPIVEGAMLLLPPQKGGILRFPPVLSNAKGSLQPEPLPLRLCFGSLSTVAKAEEEHASSWSCGTARNEELLQPGIGHRAAVLDRGSLTTSCGLDPCAG